MYELINGHVLYKDKKDFTLSETLECGQMFRFEKQNDGAYQLIAKKRLLTLKEETEGIWFYNTNLKDFEEIWIPYFDLKVNYSEIKKILSQKDDIMQSATTFGSGIRIVNQEVWECMLSFILSQNNNIPRIKQLIKTISKKYGTQIGDDAYAFPTVEQLKNVSVDEFYACKMGFRAKYIKDAVERVYTGDIVLEEYDKMTTEEASKSLMRIFGVGPKVSDCILLYSLNRREVFPTDVWVKRVMQAYYFDNASIKEIQELAKEQFGEYAGYAQQYLFHYARTHLSFWNFAENGDWKSIRKITTDNT